MTTSQMMQSMGIGVYRIEPVKEEKTTKWYPYEDMGSFYKLETGTLQFAPMNEDGTMDGDEGYDVEWELIKNEPLEGFEGKTVGQRLKEIVKELEVKE